MQVSILRQPSGSVAMVQLPAGETIELTRSAIVNVPFGVRVESTDFAETCRVRAPPDNSALLRLAPPRFGDLTKYELVDDHEIVVATESLIAADETVSVSHGFAGIGGLLACNGLRFSATRGRGGLLFGGPGPLETLEIRTDIMINPRHLLAMTSGVVYEWEAAQHAPDEHRCLRIRGHGIAYLHAGSVEPLTQGGRLR